MRNEFVMKTLPGAALWIYVHSHERNTPLRIVRQGRRGNRGKRKEIAEGEKKTNLLHLNKELSQQIGRPYINYEEALGDLPTGLNKA